MTYLVYELVWAIPVLAVQWIVGRAHLWCCRRTLAVSVLLSTSYLCLTDSIAINSGIWTIHPNRIIGLALGNLPAEEAVFFLLTSAIVAQTVILLSPRGPSAQR